METSYFPDIHQFVMCTDYNHATAPPMTETVREACAILGGQPPRTNTQKGENVSSEHLRAHLLIAAAAAGTALASGSSLPAEAAAPAHGVADHSGITQTPI